MAMLIAVALCLLFLDAISITYVFMPILAYYNIDLLFFGILFVVALAIGQITPPVAVNLYVAANLVKSTLDKVAKEVWINVIAVIAGLIFLTFFPQIKSVYSGYFRTLYSIKMANLLVYILLLKEQDLNESNINKNINFNYNSCTIG